MPVVMADDWSKGIRKWTADRAEWVSGHTPARRFRITYPESRRLRLELIYGEQNAFPRHTKLSDVVTQLQEVWKIVRVLVRYHR